MHNRKRTYYRNYYQENLAKVQQIGNSHAMRPYSTVNPTQYRANHHSSQPLRSHSSSSRRKEAMELSLHSNRNGGDVFRGIALGLPLFIGILVIIYATGLFSLPNSNELITTTFGPEAITYLDDYESLVTSQNKLNETIATGVRSGEFSALTLTELTNLKMDIQALTMELESCDIDSFEQLSYLFKLSLSSINTVVDVLVKDNVSTDEISTAYSQFVKDQNSVGEQISTELVNIFNEANIPLEKAMGGKFTLPQ